MRRFGLAAILLAGLCVALPGGFSRATEESAVTAQSIDGGRFGAVRYYAPAEGRPIEGLVVLVSDRQGWNEASEALAQHLVEDGQAILGIDLATYLGTLRNDQDDCSWVNGDFEFLSRRTEKDLPFHEFHPPVILGMGAGATVAYAATVEVLPNTFAGGVGLGFSPAVATLERKLCVPTEPAKPGEALRYAPAPGHETPWLFTPATDFGPAAIHLPVRERENEDVGGPYRHPGTEQLDAARLTGLAHHRAHDRQQDQQVDHADHDRGGERDGALQHQPAPVDGAPQAGADHRRDDRENEDDGRARRQRAHARGQQHEQRTHEQHGQHHGPAGLAAIMRRRGDSGCDLVGKSSHQASSPVRAGASAGWRGSETWNVTPRWAWFSNHS